MTLSTTINHGNFGMYTRFYNTNIKTVKSVLPEAVKEMKTRADKPGQFLSWVSLPEKQMKRVDEIYTMVQKLREQSPAKVLTVLGIGGSKHTVEHMLGINGLNLKGDKVKFYSDIDSVSFNRFLQQIDGDPTKSNYLVVSKSGSTFETKDGMLRVMDKLADAYGDRALFPIENGRKVDKHMVAVTDAKPDTQLRKFASEHKWLGDLYIHDDVGGRFSQLDDHALFALAWAGMKKPDMVKMLQAANEMSDVAMKDDISKNTPLAQAAFWAQHRMEGIRDGVHKYLGDMFEKTAVWHTQMQNESIKDSAKQITKITDAMHHSSEAWYNPANKYSHALTAPIDKGVSRENVEGYIDAITKADSEYGPAMLELLETNDLGLTPEAAGAMSQSRNFSTVYQGIIDRLARGIEQPEVLPEVLQPNVENYKKNLKPLEGHKPPVEAGRMSVIA